MSSVADLQCARCGRSVADWDSEIWDGKHYCKHCLKECDLDSGPQELIEQHSVDQKTQLKQNFQGAFWGTTITAALVSGGAALIVLTSVIASALGGPHCRIGLREVLLGTPLFFGISWLLIACLLIPVFLIVSSSRRKTTVRVVDGTLLVEDYGFGTMKAALTDIRCTITPFASDGWNSMPGDRDYIELDLCGTRRAVCGYTDDTFQMWRGFFELNDVEFIQPLHWRRLTERLLLALVFGAVVGALVGKAMTWITGEPVWILAGIAVGWANGLLYVSESHRWQVENWRSKERIGNVWVTGLRFSAIPVFFGIGALECSQSSSSASNYAIASSMVILNAVFGFALAIRFSRQRRMREATRCIEPSR